MEFFLIGLVVILGIALSISLLNKLQRQRSREQLERSTPLSEPDFDFSRIGSSGSETSEDKTSGAITSAADTSEVGTPGTGASGEKAEELAEKGQDLPLPLEEPPDAAAPPATLSELVPLIRQFRDNGDLEKARELCKLHLPKTQAFQQLLMTQRISLKALMQQKLDATEALFTLYTTAVVAELYRSSRKLPSPVLQPSHVCALLEHFRPDYQQLGYSNLRGLTRADVGLLVRRWGEPLNQQHPVTALPPTWWQIENPTAQDRL